MTYVSAVREALYALLIDDDGLTDALGGHHVYDEQAPEGAPLRYVVIGGTEERGSGRSTFGGGERDGLENLRIFTKPDPGERSGAKRAKEIYGHLFRILDGVTLEIEGAVVWNAKVRLVTTFMEQDRITTAAPAQYTYETIRR